MAQTDCNIIMYHRWKGHWLVRWLSAALVSVMPRMPYYRTKRNLLFWRKIQMALLYRYKFFFHQPYLNFFSLFFKNNKKTVKILYLHYSFDSHSSAGLLLYVWDVLWFYNMVINSPRYLSLLPKWCLKLHLHGVVLYIASTRVNEEKTLGMWVFIAENVFPRCLKW